MKTDEENLAWQTLNLNWLPIALLGAALLSALTYSDFSLEPVGFGVLVAIAISLASIAYVYAHIRQASADPKLVFWFGVTAQIILLTAIAGPLSYVANAMNWPLQDRSLLWIDRAIGFDPQGIAAFFNAHSWIVHYLKVGYGFIKWPLLAIPIILAMGSRFLRLQQFVLTLSVALAVTIVVSAFIPAIGTYYGLGLSPGEQFPKVDSANYAAQLRDIFALRDGSLRQLDVLRLAGIVSFPSFHTASAVLYIWALWPIRVLRPASIALNTWMVAATPLIGAHYIIDLIGGAVVAGGSIVMVKHFLRSLLVSSQRRAQSHAYWPSAMPNAGSSSE
ncbi:phosphatase PAP2 family protein [Bradyrhizobium sp. HKCCYLRH1062]|uniref:phosphatase PAP2 family protein n=1 Tax=unclassified Bradyrhizobium TaxID=2631580 RepID=UPI003EB8B54C